MEQRESLQNHKQTYGEEFQHLFDYYAQRGSSFEWQYQKSEFCRVQFARDLDRLIICIDHIKYDGDLRPQYTPLYMVIEEGGEAMHFHHSLERNQVPYLAFTAPELTLRSVLGVAQETVRYRR